MTHPKINVTPLIDVLLVLLIIFMAITPLKPSAFKARIPAEPLNEPKEPVTPHPDTLVITIANDSTLALNTDEVGSVQDIGKLVSTLKTVFDARVASGNVSKAFADDPDRPVTDRIERTVFIKAPKSLAYGSVARVVDAAKSAGAYPISLQIDRLDQ